MHSYRPLLKQGVHDFDGGLRGRVLCLAILSHGILDAFQERVKVFTVELPEVCNLRTVFIEEVLR